MATGSTASLPYDVFIRDHRNQLLDQLQIPEQLLPDFHKQLLGTYVSNHHDTLDLEHSMLSVEDQLNSMHRWVNHISEHYGSLVVLPHAVSWDMSRGQDFVESLESTDEKALHLIWKGLEQLHAIESDSAITSDLSVIADQTTNLADAIADHPLLWSRVVLYRSVDGIVRGAVPSPPFLPQLSIATKNTDNGVVMESIDADCTGPFPFRYFHPITRRAIDLSLLYVSPTAIVKMQESSMQGKSYLPTMDLVPYYQYPNDSRTRMVRYASLFPASQTLRACHVESFVKEIYATFIRQMHLIRQQTLENRKRRDQLLFKTVYVKNDAEVATTLPNILKVFTDSNDPMKLKHPIAGLEANSNHFQIVHDIDTADIVFSYQSVFSPNHPFHSYLQDNCNIMINQFPYEGAMVQKDHLARELLKQHGLPRPLWALETYDLDVHMAEMVGSVLLAIDDIESLSNTSSSKFPLWIIKPACGTQSQGHIVTRSLSHILRLNDAEGGRRVAQRYIENPVCIDSRKIDCRIIVLMTSAGKVDENGDQVKLPTLFMHKNCYFRIANKPHVISTPRNRLDCEAVLTASHLLSAEDRTSVDDLRKLPTHADAIKQLEKEYPDSFNWESEILPQIQSMIRELFNGMTSTYPQMTQYPQSRAAYGVDVMFQIEKTEDHLSVPSLAIVPKLTEVTFCPANNAVCDAYTRDERLYRSYNKDIFECLFLGLVSSNILQLQ